MTIVPIAPLPVAAGPGLDPRVAMMAPAPVEIGTTPDFATAVKQGIETVNQGLLSSEADLQKIAVGTEQNLHGVMIRLEQSRLSFQLLMQVRSRLLDAYQDVMRMQI